MSGSNSPLLSLLASGDFVSGEQLAEVLGVSRTAVWKQLNKVAEQTGVELESVRGRGYRIPGGLDLLSASEVRGLMRGEARSLLAELCVQEHLDSTNAEALRRAQSGAPSGLVCTAEQQSAGRGRRGRQWVSPYARNLYVSALWTFHQGAGALEGLSLAVGVAVADALRACGLPAVQLKWPNDVQYQGAKLGGILIEMVGDATGACQVVVGVGLNVAMPAAAADQIDQRWCDVRSMVPDTVAPPSRNALLAELLNALLPLLAAFETSGFSVWRDQWMALDANADTPVTIDTGEMRLAGTARGVDERGALLLETTSGVQTLYGGEISLRAAQ